jgi:hypothetical protein
LEQDISTMRTLHTSIWVKYVRREISTLTDTDREEFLNALHVLWDVSSKKGSAKVRAVWSTGASS